MHHTPFNFQFDMNHFGDLSDCAGSIEPSVGGAKGNEDIEMSATETSTCPKEDCTRKLTSLAVEFQRHLMLINSYSTGAGADAQHWLSTYPIGEILCLSGDFASLLKPELYQHGRGASVSICEHDGVRPPSCTQVGRKERHDTIGSDVAHRNHPHTPESMSSASTPSPTSTSSSRPSSSSVSVSTTSNGVDTPMALLILNCYVSMIRIYSALFAHLYAHLGRSAAGVGLTSRTDPGLKFGELPAAGDDVSLRTYTAVRLLLAALQHSEELLDLPDDLRCVLNVSAAPNDREEAASSSNSEASSGSEAEQRLDLAERVGREMIASELARAVFRQEAQMSAELGGGGLMLLRKNIEGVKTSLRQRMQL
ncbi:hypothetical protein DBV05_g10178 [Lasiodiplodia theobromae]|uniref:Uncharacterized protein n=1 Tax=Lasiodiplodia theobromae TaxID=45133 RepID=A0A5N5D0H6_9PEZI|nr:hypothetical protein DBV05_g10178 [Lasiodiplodia theobromae]